MLKLFVLLIKFHMPLPGTHLKFALDLRDKYHVNDLSKYLSGTIYPDSRYLSGIDYGSTHGERFVFADFMVDDFRKGWAVHYVCDKLFHEISDKIFPDYFGDSSNVELGSDWWVAKTSLKVVLDLGITEKFNLNPYLFALDYADNPNGESLDKVEQFNSLTKNLYLKKPSLDEIEKFLSSAVDFDVVRRIASRSREFLNDGQVMAKIITLEESMLKMASD